MVRVCCKQTGPRDTAELGACELLVEKRACISRVAKFLLKKRKQGRWSNKDIEIYNKNKERGKGWDSETDFRESSFYKKSKRIYIIIFNIGNISFFGDKIILRKNQNQLKKNCSLQTVPSISLSYAQRD